MARAGRDDGEAVKRLICAGSALALLWACAHPTADFDADEPSKSGGAGGSGGKGGSGSASGGNKPTTAGSAGKGGSKPAPELGGAGGASDGDAGEPGAESGGEPGTVDPGPSAPPGDLAVHYRAGNASVSDNQIGAHLRVVSSALAPVELSNLSLRYYFTSEPAPPLIIELYTAAAEGTSGYRALPSGSVLAEVKEGFAEVTFTTAAGLLDAGGQVTVELAIHDTGWSGLFNESDDYSFNAAHSSFTAWDKVTLFDGKTLVSGIEPP